MPVAHRKLRVFFCHANEDKPFVHELYEKLRNEQWIDPWLDKDKLLPGQEWIAKIEEAVEKSDVVLVCMSNNSVSKEGAVQRELRYAMSVALEKPEDTIFLVPLRLGMCKVPRSFNNIQWVNYFGDEKEKAYVDLIQSLRIRYNQVIKPLILTEELRARELAQKQHDENVRREADERDRKQKYEDSLKIHELESRLQEEQSARTQAESQLHKQFKKEARNLARERNNALIEDILVEFIGRLIIMLIIWDILFFSICFFKATSETGISFWTMVGFLMMYLLSFILEIILGAFLIGPFLFGKYAMSVLDSVLLWLKIDPNLSWNTPTWLPIWLQEHLTLKHVIYLQGYVQVWGVTIISVTAITLYFYLKSKEVIGTDNG